MANKLWFRSSWSSATEFFHYLIPTTTRTTATRKRATKPGSSESQRKFFGAQTEFFVLFFLTPSERRIGHGQRWKFFFPAGFAFLRFSQAKEQLTTQCLGQLILRGSDHPSHPECSRAKTDFVANIWVGGEKCALFQGQGRQRQFQWMEGNFLIYRTQKNFSMHSLHWQQHSASQLLLFYTVGQCNINHQNAKRLS